MVSFYNDQGTHHAAALTYYALMSLFPAAASGCVAVGSAQASFPSTYNAIVRHLHGVVPAVTLAPLGGSGEAPR